MSLIVRHRPPTEARGWSTAAMLNAISMPMQPAGFVDPDSSLRHDAVWSCRTRIAQDVSMMPVDVVRYVNGQRQDVTPSPQIVAAPSVFVPAMDWRYQVIDSWLGWGNAWGIVTATNTSRQYPTRIELVSPSTVRVQEVPGSWPRFFVDNVEHELWPTGDLWHSPAYTQPGQLLGLSPISYHRLSISTGLEAENYGNAFFLGGGHPTGIIAPGSDPGPEGAKSIKEKFAAALRGSREPIVLPQHTTYIPLQTNPTDSQFIDTMRYSVEQVCRIYGEDPADHGSSGGGSSVTYSNRSDADLARLKRRQFWVTKLQSVLTDMLPKPQVARLNTSVSLMMTARERHELHKLRLDSKTRTINEVRLIEDETPFDGDEYNEPGIPDDGPDEPPAEMEPADDRSAMRSIQPAPFEIR